MTSKMNDYEMKLEAKRQRMLARADKLDGVAARGRKTFESIHSFIPFGQPILVGHHSEKRHRRELDKANRAMQMSFDAQKLAGELRARASGLGEHGISSDDPDAPSKIKEKIAELEALQAKMKDTNKLLKKGDDAGLAAMGYSAATIASLKVPQWGNGRGPIGFPPYALQNNNANIRRYKDRLAQVERLAEREHKETPMGNSGVTMVENPEINRLQLKFPGKPDAEVRHKLKRAGFRWSPSEGAWQRQLTGNAKYAAQEIVNGL